MALVWQEVKVCNNNTSFEKSFCFKGQLHNYSTPVHSFQRVQEPVDGHVFVPDWETSTLLQSRYLLSQPAGNPDTHLPPELCPWHNTVKAVFVMFFGVWCPDMAVKAADNAIRH